MLYRDYHKTWVSIVGEILQCQMGPQNMVDKSTVAVIKKDKVFGHLVNGSNGKFVKTVFFS